MRTPSWDAAVLDAKRLVARVQKCCLYQFCDPFDDYNTASQMYELVSGSAPTYSSSYARFAPPAGLPGQGVKFAGGGYNYVTKNMLSNQATYIIKIAFNLPSLGSGVNGSPFLAVADGGGGLASVQFCIVSFANGSLGIIRSINGGTLIAQTGPGVVAANAWYGMEIEVPVGSSVTGQIWVNGSQVLNVSGLNTQATSHAYGSQVWIGNLNNQLGAGVIMDDFRVWDNTGANMNAPVGLDTRLVTKLPSGAVTTSWTPNGSAANWQCEDDSPPDGDTTYTSNASTPSYETYSMISAGFTAAPVMVVARSMVRKDDGATRTMQNGAWRGSGGYSGYGSGTGSFTVGSTYQFFDCAVALDPGSGSAWTAATADAALFYKSETA